MPPPPLAVLADAPAWQDWASSFAPRLCAVQDEESVTVSAPEDSARPVAIKGGVVGRLLGRQHEMLAPWVTVTRSEGLLRCECIRGTDRGKGFPMSREDQEFILSLGWHEAPAETTAYVRFFPDDIPVTAGIQLVDALAAAATIADVMRRAFAVDDPDTLVVSTGRTP